MNTPAAAAGVDRRTPWGLAASLVSVLHDGTPRGMAAVITAAAVGSTIVLFSLALPRDRRA
jgi:hypothetical protein